MKKNILKNSGVQSLLASLLCVTHDPEEAALLGGRCLDLSAL